MQYCALDVLATHQVFTEQLPLFMERSGSASLTFPQIQTESLTQHMILQCSKYCMSSVIHFLFSVFYKVSSPGDVCRDAGDGCELPSC